MAKIWPCSNTYVPVCKDAAKQFKLGAAQRFKIGKVDPNDPDISKMVCEVESKDNVQASSYFGVKKSAPCKRMVPKKV